MMRINQVCISPSLQYMSSRFRSKYKLEEYSNLLEPAIFFGCYSVHSIRQICNYKSLAVVVWGGTDAKLLRQYLDCKREGKNLGIWYSKLIQQQHVRHIAISEYIAEDLRKVGLQFSCVPINTVLPEKFKVCKPGKLLYSYGYTRRPAVYNEDLVKRVLRQLGNVQLVQGEIGTDKTIPYEGMSAIYSKCFMGLRLTAHDGLPNTVIELGLMGIRCIYNGCLPNAVKWIGIEDIVANIHKEQERIGFPNEEIARKMREYITISDDWLDTAYWNYI